jgi:hypothetical protein
MKKIITLILLSSTLILSAQHSDLSPNAFRTSLLFSPDLYFSKVERTFGTGYEIEQNFFNYSAGVMGYYRIDQRFEIGTGVQYSNKDVTATWYCDLCDYLEMPEYIKLRYLEIPLVGRYYLWAKNLEIFVEAGITNSLLLNPIGKKIGALEANSYYISGQSGMGINIKLTPRIQWTSSLLYRHGLTDGLRPNGIDTQNDIQYQSIGLAVGMQIKL